MKFEEIIEDIEIDINNEVKNFTKYTMDTVFKNIVDNMAVQSGDMLASTSFEDGYSEGKEVKLGLERTPGTNSMPLGSEPNRDAATNYAMATASNINWDKVDKIVTIANGHHKTGFMELGLLPKQETARAKGMFIGGYLELNKILGANLKGG